MWDPYYRVSGDSRRSAKLSLRIDRCDKELKLLRQCEDLVGMHTTSHLSTWALDADVGLSRGDVRALLRRWRYGPADPGMTYDDRLDWSRASEFWRENRVAAVESHRSYLNGLRFPPDDLWRRTEPMPHPQTRSGLSEPHDSKHFDLLAEKIADRVVAKLRYASDH